MFVISRPPLEEVNKAGDDSDVQPQPRSADRIFNTVGRFDATYRTSINFPSRDDESEEKSMKTMLLGTALFGIMLAGTAHAQPGSDGSPPPAMRHDDRRAPPPPPPSHWRHSHDQWQRHVERCSERYRSYNPRTDRYTYRPGHTAICKL
ncbi:BA14K family protein [Novosphingobium sp. BL-8A]|uniref:BA14K family protein n=1 Tax=Novosphingobium sp. BL-8A TaxID=3127639 RepID=UPI003757D45A